MSSVACSAVVLVGLAAIVGCGSSDAEPRSAFASLYADVFQPAGCTAGYCHGGAHAANLDMETEDRAYANLVRVAVTAKDCDVGARVQPGKPDESLLWRKVAPGMAACGPKMPLGTLGLSSPDAERVRQWIAAGALR